MSELLPDRLFRTEDTVLRRPAGVEAQRCTALWDLGRIGSLHRSWGFLGQQGSLHGPDTEFRRNVDCDPMADDELERLESALRSSRAIDFQRFLDVEHEWARDLLEDDLWFHPGTNVLLKREALSGGGGDPLPRRRWCAVPAGRLIGPPGDRPSSPARPTTEDG